MSEYTKLKEVSYTFGPQGIAAMALLMLDQSNMIRQMAGLPPATVDEMVDAWQIKYDLLANEYAEPVVEPPVEPNQ